MRDFEAQVPNFEPATGDYPNGQIRDTAGPTAGTGVVEALYGDVVQFFLKLMIDAGLTANTLPENVTNGYQLIDALVSKAREALTGGVLADLNTVTFNGFFEAGISTLNAPVVQAGTVVHIAIGTGVTAATQIFNSSGSDQLFTRRKVAGSWLPWVEYTNITSEGDVTITAGNSDITILSVERGKYKQIGDVMHGTLYFSFQSNVDDTNRLFIDLNIAKVIGDILTSQGGVNAPIVASEFDGASIRYARNDISMYLANVFTQVYIQKVTNFTIGEIIWISYQGSYIMQ